MILLKSNSQINQIDYRIILDSLEINYSEDDFYLRVGTPAISQGWIIHLSVVVKDAKELIKKSSPIFANLNVPHKIIKNSTLHQKLNDGEFGKNKVGKIVTVFLDNPAIANTLLKQLIEITSQFEGPKVFTDLPIQNTIFTRYGSFTNIIETDSLGNKVKLIKDQNNRLVLDQYYTPPIIPSWVPNPFLTFITIHRNSLTNKKINNKIRLLSIIKEDIKGDVWKGIYLNRFLIPQSCIVKQGRPGIYSDPQGRDARDRLKWQYNLNKILFKKIRTPKVWKYSTSNKSIYLPIKYIKGESFYATILNILQYKPWSHTDKKNKIKILSYLLKIAAQIKQLHDNYYIHRDITSSNFLVNKRKKVFSIDLELMYSEKENTPDPPFRIGTPGYMSPEQNSSQKPTYSDDIYSFGALLCTTITGGIEPLIFIDEDELTMKHRIKMFSGSDDFTVLILDCINKEPNNRPSIDVVYNRLEKHKTYLKQKSTAKEGINSSILQEKIKESIQGGILSLSKNKMAQNGLWYSKIDNSYDWEVYPMLDKHHFGGLYRGVGGIILTLLKLKELGFDISSTNHNLKNAVTFLKTNIFTSLSKWDPSFYYGQAGYGLLIDTFMEEKIMDRSDSDMFKLNTCFNTTSSSLNVLHGIAGQGLSLLQCKNIRSRAQLHIFAERLTNQQKKDGSWLLGSTSEKTTGFGYGIAGIIYFLLEYGYKMKNQAAIDSAESGLRYLTKQKKTRKNIIFWTQDEKSKIVGRWWCNGVSGIALTYLKAYEFMKKPSYLQIAEKALLLNDKNLINHDLSQCHGLIGLGEIYIEAFTITRNHEWLERATWIMQILLALKKKNATGEAYWLTANLEIPTADFMIGNSGILHFLLRYLNPEKVGFPILQYRKNSRLLSN